MSSAPEDRKRREQFEQARREQRWTDAVTLATDAGWLQEASKVAEQACLFEQAAELALQSQDAYRAVHLAALSGRKDIATQAVEMLAKTPDKARGAAASLQSRGQGQLAGALFSKLNMHADAATAYESAGDATNAAAEYLADNDDRQAARVLEAELNRRPDNDEASVMLGELLVRHARYQPATRVLQRVQTESPWRQRALPPLIACYDALGLDEPKQALLLEADTSSAPTPTDQLGPTDDGDGKTIFGRYVIQQQVATTAAAVVYQALDNLTGQLVAVKQLQFELIAGAGRDAFGRLVREARALQQLHHPNIIPLVELVEEGGAIVTPWMPGGSMADQLSSRALAPARAVEIASCVLDALGQAHRMGILHRDIKPSNILFDAAGTPQLADFGAAHVADTSSTATADIIGTFGYMSPEQRWGMPATPASDVYGVGATLLEMLTGQHPSGTDDWTPVTPSSVVPELTPQHDALLLSLLAPKAQDRPQQALQARQALLSMAWPTDVTARRRPSRPQPSKTRTNSRLQVTGPHSGLDTRMKRPVTWIKNEERTLQLARLYAAAEGRGLCDVLRVDQEQQAIWFAVPAGKPLRQTGAPLTPAQTRRLTNALGWLHQHGFAHGSVDIDHVFLCQQEVTLAFEPSSFHAATPQQDMRAVQALTGVR